MYVATWYIENASKEMIKENINISKGVFSLIFFIDCFFEHMLLC